MKYEISLDFAIKKFVNIPLPMIKISMSRDVKSRDFKKQHLNLFA